MTWTSERCAKLYQRWVVDRWYGGKIADEMGITRNAVLGKVWRMGWRKPMDMSDAARARRYSRTRLRIKMRKEPEPSIVKFEDAPVAVQTHEVPLLSHRGCQYPVTMYPGTAIFDICGKMTFKGPYCLPHHRDTHIVKKPDDRR